MAVNAASGFLLIDKPAGLSSFDVIRQLRKATGVRDFGHAGSLDPFATGLLIIAVNRYTRLLHLLETAHKAYSAVLTLGKSTTTGDPQGEVINTSDYLVTEEDLKGLREAVLRIEKLKPPVYSAIKIDGKRAYKQARKGEAPELPERESHIFEFEISSFLFPQLRYSCRVSKGTYIRSLSLWIAEFLKSAGHTSALTRTAIGSVTLEKAKALSDVTSHNLQENLWNALDILPDLECITINDLELYKLRQGRSVINNGPDNPCMLILDEKSDCRGYGFRKDNILCPKVNL